MLLGAVEGGLEDGTANIVKVDVDKVGSGLLELLAEIRVLVVDGDVEAEVVSQPLALVVGAGNANDAGAANLGQLTGNAARSAGRTRDDDGLAGLGLTNMEHAKVGRQAGGAEDREVVGGVGDGRVGSGGLDGGGRQNGVLSPASVGRDDIASGGLVRLGGENTRDGGSTHRLANLNRGQVRTLVCGEQACQRLGGASSQRLEP